MQYCATHGTMLVMKDGRYVCPVCESLVAKYVGMAVLLVILSGCAAQPVHSVANIDPRSAKVTTENLMASDTLLVIPPTPQPLEIPLPWPCTNCLCKLASTTNLSGPWTMSDDTYYLTTNDIAGENFIDVGLTNQLGFFALIPL